MAYTNTFKSCLLRLLSTSLQLPSHPQNGRTVVSLWFPIQIFWHVLHQSNTAESSLARPKGGQRPASAVQRERDIYIYIHLCRIMQKWFGWEGVFACGNISVQMSMTMNSTGGCEYQLRFQQLCQHWNVYKQTYPQLQTSSLPGIFQAEMGSTFLDSSHHVAHVHFFQDFLLFWF